MLCHVTWHELKKNSYRDKLAIARVPRITIRPNIIITMTMTTNYSAWVTWQSNIFIGTYHTDCVDVTITTILTNTYLSGCFIFV